MPGYRGLKIFTSLSLRFQDFQRRIPVIKHYDGICHLYYSRRRGPGTSSRASAAIQSIIKTQQSEPLAFYSRHALASPWLESAVLCYQGRKSE